MSHDRGVATKAETHRAARWQGAGRGGRGAEPPKHGQGPLPPLYGAPSASAAHEQLNAPVANAAATPPPGQRRGGPWLGLGQGVKRLSRGVVRCGHLDGRSLRRRGQLMDLAIDGGHIADRGGRLRVSGIVAQPQGMGALAVESRALVTVVRRKRAGLT